ncbi:MAG TPA: acyl-CoA synthetase [Chloroflexaceae bacterium]|nr:acyl-CoA synthetase [Chloroflexaceae bacterium]
MPPTSILAALMAHAGADPARPCVVWGEATIGYGELAAAAAGWAAAYAALGVARGDRVALYLGSGPGFLGAYLGAHAAGAAAVLVNTQYRQVELRHILADSEPRAVVADAEGAARLAELGGDPPVLTADPGQLAPPAAAERGQAGPLATSAPGDLAILAYTSGTTGRAKGAMLTHGALAANSAAVCAAWRWTAADRLLLVLPLFHIHGLGVGVHGTLMAGASLVLRPRFDPAEALADLAGGACTMFFGVPTIYTRLIQEAGGRRQVTEGVRLFVSGSAPLSPQTFADFEALFGQRILERYGMTETGMNLTNPYAGERRPGTVGGPFPGQQARVVDPRAREPLPDGEVGEIQVRGPHLFAGYWRNPAATAEVLAPDGWFSTGDLGWRSADGYYTLTGRARELIISGGYNVYPREVEELLLAHPAVAECAVLGLPDPDFGERVVAAVVPADPAAPPTQAELDAFCREGLAAYKRPRELHLLDALPRNAMGKVQKHELRARLSGG